MLDIAVRRLLAQRLIGDPFQSPIDAVRWLGAVQSQDYVGAKWAVAQRVTSASDAELDRIFDSGDILRTHVLRPTWHFVLPEDIRWLLELTGPRVRAGLAGRHRQLEIDEETIARAEAAFAGALAGGHQWTRPELGDALQRAGISPDGQRLPHLLLCAELDGVVVSGPRRGKQFTYALLEERAPAAPRLERSQAVAELTCRYFRSHGPAQLQDFVWWSGLTVADARTGLELVGSALDHHVVDGKEYWFDAAQDPAPTVQGEAHLLPNFDEYTVAYRDRAAALHADRPFDPSFFPYFRAAAPQGGILSNVLTVSGRVRGAWRRTIQRRGVRVEIRLLDVLEPAEKVAVAEAARRFGRFLELPVELAWVV
jgi:hypothetical protein